MKKNLRVNLNYFLTIVTLLCACFFSIYEVGVCNLTNSSIQQKVENNNIFLFTINDLHGCFVVDSNTPGIAKLAGAIKEYKSRVKADDKNSILLGAGDLYQGGPLSIITKGKAIAMALNKMGMRYSAIGNHEFDWGREAIDELEQNGGPTFLVANVYEKNGDYFTYSKPYKIVNIGGKTVAIIGLATMDTIPTSVFSVTKNLRFEEADVAAIKVIQKIKKTVNPDFIVAVTHIPAWQRSDGNVSGMMEGDVEGEIEKLAKVGDIDVIITGHSHTKVNGRVNNKPVVQACYNGRCFGVIKINTRTREVFTEVVDLMSHPWINVVPDIGMTNFVSEYMSYYNDVFNRDIGKIAETMLVQEEFGNRDICPLGKYFVKNVYDLCNLDAVIINSGMLRTSLAPGKFTVEDVYKLIPFSNYLAIAKVKGDDLVKLIDHALTNLKHGIGQFYGVLVEYDSTKQEGKGRIKSIKLMDGRSIEKNQYYSIGVSSFMVPNGDGYDMSCAVNIKHTNIIFRDLMIYFALRDGIITPPKEVYIKDIATSMNIHLHSTLRSGVIKHVSHK